MFELVSKTVFFMSWWEKDHHPWTGSI